MNWMALLCLAALHERSLVRHSIDLFHWRVAFIQSINWFHSINPFHSTNQLRSLSFALLNWSWWIGLFGLAAAITAQLFQRRSSWLGPPNPIHLIQLNRQWNETAHSPLTHSFPWAAQCPSATKTIQSIHSQRIDWNCFWFAEWAGGVILAPSLRGSPINNQLISLIPFITFIPLFNQIDCCLRYHRGSWCQYNNYCYNINLIPLQQINEFLCFMKSN